MVTDTLVHTTILSFTEGVSLTEGCVHLYSDNKVLHVVNCLKSSECGSRTADSALGSPQILFTDSLVPRPSPSQDSGCGSYSGCGSGSGQVSGGGRVSGSGRGSVVVAAYWLSLFN